MAADKTVFESYLQRLDEGDWAESLARILPRIHPADSRATRIWFAFWPLKLRLALDGSPDPDQVFKELQLDGKPRLEKQIDASVAFLVGSNYWAEVKQAVAAYAEEALEPQETSLDSHILELAGRLAARLQVEQSLLAGIVSVGVMVLAAGGAVFSGNVRWRTVTQRAPEVGSRGDEVTKRAGLEVPDLEVQEVPGDL